MDIAITKMSSKGQIVIPTKMRNNIKEGEKLVLIKSEKQFLIKKVDDLSKNLEEDLEFAKRTEKALKRIKTQESIKTNFNDFIKELENW